MQWLIESGRSAQSARIIVACEDRVPSRNAGGRLHGVAYDGPQIVFAGDAAAIDRFGDSIDPGRIARRMIVAPRPLVERFWKRVRNRFPQPDLIRKNQPLYAVDAATLRAPSGDIAGVGRATPDESEEITQQSARMAAGELGGDPEYVDADYRHRIESIVRAGLFWRCRSGGRLVFQCHLGPITAATAQIQGIWTPPGERRKGYATRALATICKRLLGEHRTLSLYVNDFNREAIRLYERLGFRRVGEFASIIF